MGSKTIVDQFGMLDHPLHVCRADPLQVLQFTGTDVEQLRGCDLVVEMDHAVPVAGEFHQKIYRWCVQYAVLAKASPYRLVLGDAGCGQLRYQVSAYVEQGLK